MKKRLVIKGGLFFGLCAPVYSGIFFYVKFFLYICRFKNNKMADSEKPYE